MNGPRRKLKKVDAVVHKNGRVTRRVKRDPLDVKGENNLTPREEIVAASYVTALAQGSKRPLIEAGQAAGGVSAAAVHHAINKNPDVQQRIDEHTNEVLERLGVTTEFIIQKLKDRANFDIRKLYDEDGRLLELHELDDETAASISGLEIEKEYEGRGEDREQVASILKYKSWNALDAIKMLASIKRIDGPQRTEITGAGGTPLLAPPNINVNFIAITNK